MLIVDMFAYGLKENVGEKNKLFIA